MEEPGHLVQGIQHLPLLSGSGPEEGPPDLGSDEEDGAVEEGEAWRGVTSEHKNLQKNNNSPVITVRISSQNQRKT